MTPAEQLQKAQEARHSLDAHLTDAFAAVRGAYRDRLAAVAAAEPWAVDKIRSLALALKVAETVEAHIEAIAAGGATAQAALDYTRKIEKMSPERRKILGIG